MKHSQNDAKGAIECDDSSARTASSDHLFDCAYIIDIWFILYNHLQVIMPPFSLNVPEAIANHPSMRNKCRKSHNMGLTCTLLKLTRREAMLQLRKVTFFLKKYTENL